MRKEGKTTRLIDDAIQTLFKEGSICVPHESELPFNSRGIILKIFIDEDAHETNRAQSHFRDRLFSRLFEEHRGSFNIKGNVVFRTKY